MGCHCCCYDEGYEDGLDEGRSDVKAVEDVAREAMCEALTILAQEATEHDSEALRRAAEKLRYDYDFEMRVKRYRKRAAEIQRLYAEAKVA